MTTVPQDLIYFLNPVNAPVSPVPEGAQIVVLEARDRDQSKLGEIMRVTATWHDDIRLWYRGEDGSYYDGPMIGKGAQRSAYAIDLVGDEAVLGYVNGTYTIATGQAHALSYASRWSGKQLTVNGAIIAEHYGVNTMPAAPWAADLWPIPTDDADIRAAKIAVAKQKWETRIKHLGIIREGQRRDWLYILESHNFLEDHGMKRPIYGALVTGHVSLPANQQVRTEDLSSRTTNTLNTLTRFRTRPDTTAFDAQIQVPVQFVYPGHGALREGQSIHTVDPHQLTSHFQAASDNYEVTVTAQSVQPTITGMNN